MLYEGDDKLDPDLRQAVSLKPDAAVRAFLKERALALKPELERAFGTPAFRAAGVEIELAAHGEGAHFDRHIDTLVVRNRRPTTGILTLVLYLHRRPKRFAGGELRFYAIGGPETVDIAPVHNLLLAFPSIAPHSIRRVSCPGTDFADRRFAINMWIHG